MQVLTPKPDDILPVAVMDGDECRAIASVPVRSLYGLQDLTAVTEGSFILDGGWVKDALGPAHSGVYQCKVVDIEYWETLREFGVIDITSHAITDVQW